MRTALILFLAAVPALGQTPRVKSVEKQGEWDIVTLESGGAGKVLVPKSAPAEKRGLVMAFHGTGGSPDEMLRYGAALAEHRGEVWCAYRASGAEDGRRAWVPARDYKGIAEMLRYVVEAYKVEPGKAIGFGFSMGGLTALNVCPADKALYAGFVICAGTGVPGESGGDCTGMRAVVLIGTKDGNFALMDRWRPAIAKAGPGIATWIVTDLDHELPDAIYVNDALNYVVDAAQKGGEKTLPMKPDHPLAAPGPAAPPEFVHAYFAWKSAKAPAGVTRTKLAAKTLAEGWLSKLRKGEKGIDAAAEESDDAETKARGGATDLDKMAAYGGKLADRAKAMKPGTWEVVETESGYHVVGRARVEK